MRPADQCLESLQPVLLQGIERLEIHLELALANGGAQIQFHAAALLRLLVECRLEEVMRTLAFPLGAVECQIGVLHQCLAIQPVGRRDRNAQAGTGIGQLAFDLDPLTETHLQTVGQSGYAGLRPQAVQHDREFIAAHAGHDGIGHARLQIFRDAAQ